MSTDPGGPRSILYVVPGHDLLTTAGPTRNALSLAGALTAHADVTVAFRRLREPVDAPYRTVAIEAAGPTAAGPDDAAIRGIGVRELVRYVRSVDSFVAREAPRHDLVLEKSWLLSGRVAERVAAAGRAAAVLENVVRVALPSGGPLLARLRSGLVRHRVARTLRRVPCIVAETPELARALHDELGVSEDRIAVVDLGVDRTRFRPIDQREARRTLALDTAQTLLLYFGVLDPAHDLAPLVRALAIEPRPDVTLHVVGDGEQRASLEALVRATGARVVFHGRVPHDVVPLWIGASDLCVAPYAPHAFPSGAVAYSTLKIPEALACGRPVAGVASGSVARRIRPGVSGFLVEPDDEAWVEFLRVLPARAQLAEMGRAAAATDVRGWDDVASDVLAACAPLLRD